ncbi:hypothetical protein BCR41DRAFT_372426 [Lobosporangium transversale]|uniref:Uncharacterized protein n=1 Tax=Lobosporangium transversale TaxID=64571 RepID=A0A1Y2GH35_9FUNG|nr:hypothetical protein BCR41DRAFT_372426 [Lobosporangium transversale]ORZ10684.1 hypothetical protein BCR41DRAFT_372426 [Lobosporangium transversale]|eukprot:XP_021879405.1 hypothetical protein BCR41DRAFT_372426 [Lobosporangium transversale]
MLPMGPPRFRHPYAFMATSNRICRFFVTKKRNLAPLAVIASMVGRHSMFAGMSLLQHSLYRHQQFYTKTTARQDKRDKTTSSIHSSAGLRKWAEKGDPQTSTACWPCDKDLDSRERTIKAEAFSL